ncbi:hypothetical protein BT69DRAFT_1215495 [Atractiella rhizophila]|nr:hypothetical protein BT69DRAFT_1215495 [Atractiella rhizophila]
MADLQKQPETYDGLKVIGLGLGRTGTGSVRDALRVLGYKTFHMSENPTDLDHYSTAWPLLYAKADKGMVTREDFDRIFSKGGYTATQDFPTCCFPRELLAAYPDAKFILTVRDPAKWKYSVDTTVARGGRWPLYHLVRFLRNERALKLSKISSYCQDRFFVGDMEAKFTAHVEECKRIIPPNQLLVYRVEEGWEPLCRFLEKPIPDLPFPHSHEGKEMKAGFDIYEKMLWKQAGVLGVKYVIAMGAVALGLLAWRKGDVLQLVGRR